MRHLAVTLCLALAGATSALAQEATAPHLAIELNTVETVEGACRMSFLIRNHHAAEIRQAVFEAVLFDAEGQVDRLTLFDFGALPAGRPRVRQFVVPQIACEGLGQVLFNGAQTCAGEDLPEAACESGLRLSSRAAVALLG